MLGTIAVSSMYIIANMNCFFFFVGETHKTEFFTIYATTNLSTMSVVVRVPISISTSTLRLFFREISE
jgi:hypothetical protein